MARWQVFHERNSYEGREFAWVALLVHKKFALFRTWREAYDFADREARR